MAPTCAAAWPWVAKSSSHSRPKLLRCSAFAPARARARSAEPRHSLRQASNTLARLRMAHRGKPHRPSRTQARTGGFSRGFCGFRAAGTDRAQAPCTMRITSLLVSLFALLCSTPSFARAADVAFFPVETTNLVPADSYAVGELLAQAYAGVTHQAVLAPSRTQDVLGTAVTYEAAAQQLGVGEYVRTSAVAVGRKIVIQATRYQSNGQVVFVSK